MPYCHSTNHHDASIRAVVAGWHPLKQPTTASCIIQVGGQQPRPEPSRAQRSPAKRSARPVLGATQNASRTTVSGGARSQSGCLVPALSSASFGASRGLFSMGEGGCQDMQEKSQGMTPADLRLKSCPLTHVPRLHLPDAYYLPKSLRDTIQAGGHICAERALWANNGDSFRKERAWSRVMFFRKADGMGCQLNVAAQVVSLGATRLDVKGAHVRMAWVRYASLVV